MEKIKPWTHVVRLHPDVESEDASVATYAIDLGSIVEKDPGVHPTYKDAYSFFKATHLTKDMKSLIREVYERLSGKYGNRVLQLRSPFGGGKSHTLATLYYAVNNRKELERAFPEMSDLPKIQNVRVAVFDGEKFDALKGKTMEKLNIRTIWGYIAWQLGNYDLLEEHDRKRISPGGDLVKQMIGDTPTLIILDETLRYLEKSMAEKIGESTLYRQVLDFIQTLTTEISQSKYACMVYSLQASAREAFGNIEALQTLDHIASRVDAKREPITGDEIFYVLRKRLLDEPPPDDVVNEVADFYVNLIKKNILSQIPSDSEKREFEEKIIKYRERFRIAYPFHPALIDLMRERWASIPDFQRTRGTLRFLATVLRHLKKQRATDLLVSATDIPIDEPEVRRALLSEVGQRENYQAVLEADFIGANATVKRLDKNMNNQNSAVQKVATAILMFSFGGLYKTKDEKQGEEVLPPGVDERDLMLACISPNIDSTTIKASLKEIISGCLYIHFDGVRYSFKTIPNVNKLLEDESEVINDEEIKKKMRELMEKELGGKPAIIWPEQSRNIPDSEPVFRIVYLPFDFAYKSEDEQRKIAIEFLYQYGEKPRNYKNGIALAIPDKNHIEPLRKSIRYLIAIERIKSKKKSLNITNEQMEILEERERTEKSSRESLMRIIYNKLWLLKIENGTPQIDAVELGDRAIQATNIHDRLMELLTKISPPRVFEELKPKKILELVKDKGIEVKNIIDIFFSSPGYVRVISDDVIKKAIAEGVKSEIFGITTKDNIKPDGEVIASARERVKLGTEIDIDEIDPESSYIVPKEKIAPKEPVSRTEKKSVSESAGPAYGEKEISEELEESPSSSKAPGSKVFHISYTLRIGHGQFYKTYKAFDNIIQKSGEILLKVEANIKSGLDRSSLKGLFEEPLEEAGVIIEKKEYK